MDVPTANTYLHYTTIKQNSNQFSAKCLIHIISSHDMPTKVETKESSLLCTRIFHMAYPYLFSNLVHQPHKLLSFIWLDTLSILQCGFGTLFRAHCTLYLIFQLLLCTALPHHQNHFDIIGTLWVFFCISPKTHSIPSIKLFIRPFSLSTTTYVPYSHFTVNNLIHQNKRKQMGLILHLFEERPYFVRFNFVFLSHL